MNIYNLLALFLGLNLQFINPVSTSSNSTHILTVKFKNIQSKKGIVSFGLYKNQASFKDEKPFKIYKISKSKMVNGSLLFKLNLPAGTYGIAALDDTNNSGDMDYNFFGYPLEGFGFSNYFHSGLSAPSFNDFDFIINQSKSIEVKMKYM